jgi:hypothetical protein
MMNYGGRPEIYIIDQAEGFRITLAEFYSEREDDYNNRLSGIICTPAVGGDIYLYNKHHLSKTALRRE